MDTDDLHIRRWGTVGNGYLGPAFHARFRPGHVLYQPVAKVGIQGSTQRGPMYYTRTYGDGYDP